jgi:DGQHR domain-containing protein
MFVRKHAWDFVMVTFFAEAGDLRRWCGVYRKQINEQGYQRMLRQDHVDQIRKFLEVEKNVIPNSIVLAFNDKLTINEKTNEGALLEVIETYNPLGPDGEPDKDTEIGVGNLTVRVHPRCDTDEDQDEIAISDYRSAYVIDGQHRITGGNAASPNIYFPVTGFLGITREDQAFHFIVINRQAKKVSKHDIDAVIPKSIYEHLQERLLSASIVNSDADIVYALDNVSGSPFEQSIIWGNQKNPNAQINKGAIDKLIKYTRKLPDDVLDSMDEVDLITSIWSGIKQHLSDFWHDEKLVVKGETYDNQFLKKAVGVLPAIQSSINKAFETGGVSIDEDADDKKAALTDSIYKYVKKLPLEFFYCQWIPTSITNDSRIEALSKNISLAIRTKSVPYKQAKDWFAQPESQEQRATKKAAEKKAKSAAKRAKKSKRKAKVVKARTVTKKAAS